MLMMFLIGRADAASMLCLLVLLMFCTLFFVDAAYVDIRAGPKHLHRTTSSSFHIPHCHCHFSQHLVSLFST